MTTKKVLIPLSLLLLAVPGSADPVADATDCLVDPSDPSEQCTTLLDDAEDELEQWPHCWPIASIILEPPFVVVHDGCIFPLPP